jgi:hypothetical protein
MKLPYLGKIFTKIYSHTGFSFVAKWSEIWRPKKNTQHYISLVITKFPIPFVDGQGKTKHQGEHRTNTLAHTFILAFI